MKRSRFTEEQVAYALRQAEAGTTVADACRQLGVSEATFYVWKKKYADLSVSELRKMRQLEGEGCLGADPADPGDRAGASSIWLPADSCAASPRGVAGESEARTPALPARGAPGADAGEGEEADEPSPRPGASADGSDTRIGAWISFTIS